VGKEAVFKVSADVPTTPKTKYAFGVYLRSLRDQVGSFGDNGEKVGLGFIWETRTGLAEGGLNVLTRRLQRWLRTSGILSAMAEVYFLVQDIRYIREGDPNVVITLKED
jgi:hypothetical protein